MIISKTIQTLALASLLTFAPSEMMAAKKGGTFTTGDKTFLLNGKPFVVKAAELHYPRIPVPTGTIASRCARLWA